jgi:hypothetical protein
VPCTAEDPHPPVPVSDAERALGQGLTFGMTPAGNRLFRVVCEAHGWNVKIVTEGDAAEQVDFAWARAVP